jgi:Ca-activated chloride channel homolog
MSDRGQRSLGGPVKSCTEDHCYPARTDAEGKTHFPVQTPSTTEFEMECPLPLFAWQCPAKSRKKQWTLPLIVSIVSIITNASGQSTEFHTETNLVNVFVSVTDSNGSPVGGLSRQNFEVTEDGRTQEIAIFERTSELPLNLALAVDTSQSVFKDLKIEKNAAVQFAAAILRPQDRMSLLAFASAVNLLTPFTNNAAQIDRGIERIHGGGGTAFYDAVMMGSQLLRDKRGSKVLVIVSDGDDTAKHATYDEALEQALRNDVAVYSIIDVPIEASAGRDLRGEHVLITLAEQTGGKSFYINAGGLNKAFAQVSENLRAQYFLGYYPRHKDPVSNFHRIVVRVIKPLAGGFNVSNRAGYYSDQTSSRSRE